MEQNEAVFCVRGYHVYKDVWKAAVGKDLECERETIERCNRTSRSAKMAADAEDDNRRLLRRVGSVMVHKDPTSVKCSYRI